MTNSATSVSKRFWKPLGIFDINLFIANFISISIVKQTDTRPKLYKSLSYHASSHCCAIRLWRLGGAGVTTETASRGRLGAGQGKSSANVRKLHRGSEFSAGFPSSVALPN